MWTHPQNFPNIQVVSNAWSLNIAFPEVFEGLGFFKKGPGGLYEKNPPFSSSKSDLMVPSND